MEDFCKSTKEFSVATAPIPFWEGIISSDPALECTFRGAAGAEYAPRSWHRLGGGPMETMGNTSEELKGT